MIASWPSRAACIGADPRLFRGRTLPARPAAQRADAERLVEARIHCGPCPVRAECLTRALSDKLAEGICGGQYIEAGKVWRLAEPRPKPELIPRPCGTFAAFRRHERRGEPIDVACAAACSEYKARRYRELIAPARPKRASRPEAPCGTVAAYQRHVRRHEPTDDLCRGAKAARSRTGRGGVVIPMPRRAAS